MPIFSGNVSLLVAAPMLQDFLIDKDGTPMSGGTVTCYHDNSRTTLKNWYYQTGTPGNYTYIALPNPLTLSAAGTICDANGVDTIPFFYPYSEVNDTVKDPYYITIVNHAQTNQITRANFPFLPSSGANPNLVNAYNNLLINNGFWRNIAPNTVNVTPFTGVALNTILAANGSLFSATVAPSQHDGFRYPDIEFFKNNLTATDTVTFTPFPLANSQPISNFNVPEYYINHTSNATSMSGETQKYYQIPIALHVNSLANVPFTVSIEAQNAGGTGTGQNVITLFILQDTGTGTTSPAPIEIGQMTLNTSWSSYSFTSIFPSTSGLTLGQGGDDALYLQISMPLNTACSINFTKPSIYLTQGTIPNYDFETYDVANAVFNSARTGDLRVSVNPFYNFPQKWIYGWVPMNDGVIGLNAMSVTSTTTQVGYVRANTDTWQLYNMFWTLAQPRDSGSNFNPICQMYTNSGSALVATNYGANAYADFTANKALQLTKTFGRVLMGGVPDLARNAFYQGQSIGVTASNGGGNLLLTPTSIVGFWQGAPILFKLAAGGTLPGNITASAVYYVTNITATTFNVSTTYAGAIAGTGLVAWISSGSQVFVSFDHTGIPVGEYAHTQLQAELATHAHALTGQTGTNQTFLSSAGGTSFLSGAGGAFVTQNQGSSSPFNIVQPGVFYNIFVKL